MEGGTLPRSLFWEERGVVGISLPVSWCPRLSDAIAPLLLPREGGRGMSSAQPQMSLNAKHRLVPLAKITCRELRRRSTPAEEIFWSVVRNRRFMGKKFYRQYPIFFDITGRESFYVADFYCHEERVVVEIDGKIHEHMTERDSLRTTVINHCGIQVLRFKNEEVENSLNGVLRRLKEYLERS